jgi:glycosyltransferase involved in cell wall biosynthesis
MKLWAIAMVRDEEDIIELAIRKLHEQGVDSFLIADNLSTDRTLPILEQLAAEIPIEIVDDSDPAYRQSEKMTKLAETAAAKGADWIVPFDADELWRARRGKIRDVIERTSAGILGAPLFDHVPRPTVRRGGIAERMLWTRRNGWTKVAFRWQPGATITMGNHSVEGIACEIDRSELLIDHYPYRSWPQFRRKMRQGAAALALADEPDYMAPHWRRAAKLPDWRLRLSWWRKRLEPKARLVDRALSA